MRKNPHEVLQETLKETLTISVDDILKHLLCPDMYNCFEGDIFVGDWAWFTMSPNWKTLPDLWKKQKTKNKKQKTKQKQQ